MRCSVQNRVRGCATHPTADSTLADFSKRSKRSLHNPHHRVRGCATHPTANSTLADFRRSKRSLYASPTACVAYATPPTAGSTLADFRRSKRSLYNPPAACVAPPPTLPVDSCVGCVPSGTHALFGLYRSGRLKANAFRRPFLPNFIRYPAALCVLVRETLDSTQQAVACINRPTACVATPHTLPAT